MDNATTEPTSFKEKLVLFFLRNNVFRGAVGGLAGWLVAQLSSGGLWLFGIIAGLGLPPDLTAQVQTLLVLSPDSMAWLQAFFVGLFIYLAERLATHMLKSDNRKTQVAVNDRLPHTEEPLVEDGIIRGKSRNKIVAKTEQAARGPVPVDVLPVKPADRKKALRARIARINGGRGTSPHQ